MFKDFTYGIGCTLIFAAGALLYPVLIEGNAEKIIAVMSDLATVVAAMAAVVAINGWKKQQRHGHFFEALERLDGAVRGLVVYKRHMNDVLQYYLVKHLKPESPELSELEELYDFSNSEFQGACREFEAAVERVRLFVADEDLAECLKDKNGLDKMAFFAALKFSELLVQHGEAGRSEAITLFLGVNVAMRRLAAQLSEETFKLRRKCHS